MTFHLNESCFHWKRPNSKYRQAVEGKAHSFEVNFIPTENYLGERRDTPYPGTGQHPKARDWNETTRKQYADNRVFNILWSRKAQLNYYWDLLPNQLGDEEMDQCAAKPEWGVALQLANNTTINWGPWCDRQRDLIWAFYNPIDFNEWTYPTDPCVQRFKFDLSFSSKLDGKRSKKNQTRKPNRINIEFLDGQKRVRKFQVQCLEDSAVDVTVPYIPDQNDEFTMVTNVRLQSLQCTLESEPLSRFIQAGSFEMQLLATSSKFFNDHQTWKFDMNFDESSILFVWPVKLFLTDFINDWSREKPLDLHHYVPVTYEMSIRCNKTEVFIPGTVCAADFLFFFTLN